MQFQNSIITASAGTGKTYRLSLEFISLILRYYEHPEFKLDSILALTFTRKATAEIRERILKHLNDLCQNPESELVSALRKFVPGNEYQLSIEEQNILFSARLEIVTDMQKLQIMTIDSYTGNIFRNIVRPMKSIDSFEIDEQAANKRMPLLMNHIMKPEFRRRVNKLLSRKVHRSLDDYAKFFSELIKNRWLFYLISRRCELKREYLDNPRRSFGKAIIKLLQAIAEGTKNPEQNSLDKVILTDIKSLFVSFPSSIEHFCAEMVSMLDTPIDAMRLFSTYKKKAFFRKSAFANEDYNKCLELYDEGLKSLAEEIYYRYYLPEEEEILDIWAIILEEHDKLIYRYKTMSYQDVAWLTYEALFSNQPPEFEFDDEGSANEFYMFLSHRTRFMLIDEFQDTSLIQFNTLRPIIEEISAGFGSKDFGGLVIVGDEKQSIFGWRGGERDLLLNLRQIIAPLQNVNVDVLDRSWRAGNDMMCFINSIFGDVQLHSAIQRQGMNWPYSKVHSALGDIDATIEVCMQNYFSNRKTVAEVYQFFVDEMIIPEYNRNKEANIAIICRKASQLSQLQLLLEERGIGGVFQPSASITQHRFVAPLISWLRFVTWGGWLDFLSFVRSDYLLLSSKALKALIDEIALYEEHNNTPDLSRMPPLDELYKLAIEMKNKTAYNILREITQLCLKGFDTIPERDLLNLQAFLNIAANWELNEAQKGLATADFLDYVQENADQESFKQVSVENNTGVQLLTIHKSKGLQFDKVFVLYDLKTHHSNDARFFWASSFKDEEFSYLDDYSLSFHFDSILPYSPAAKIWEAKKKQEHLEELNNLYVAFTRARTNLHVLFTYYSTAEWKEYFASKSEDLSLQLYLADACLRYFEDSIPLPNGSWRKTSNYPEEVSNLSKSKLVIDSVESDSLTISMAKSTDWKLALNRDDVVSDYRNAYLEKRWALYGDVAHHYLSFIIHNKSDEHSRAQRECIQRFGAILGKSKLERIFAKLEEELNSNSFLFGFEYDKIFTEIAIGKYRIDRLMLNTKDKKALLVDYKTGGIHEKEQLENYRRILAKLPAFKDFSFELCYHKIHLI
ncbi:MAG: UvrD-helicase domain-containing protein [Candidatus Cloacimonetes bacterium]|nr:UvrD-helicase domain-containing protein [Candidatus Cloacimonadota bacterium]